MNHDPYLALVKDTLTYIKALLPTKEAPCKVSLPLPPKPTFAPPKPKPVAAPPPPAPPQVIEKPKEEPKGLFALELPPSPPVEPVEGMRKLLKEVAPDLYFHDKPPSDSPAKRIKEAWKEQRETPAVPILFQGNRHRKFVTAIAKAIDIVYGSCRVVEITDEKKWDLFLESENLKLILVPDHLLFGNKALLPFYQETPQQKIRKLGNTPLLLLPDLSLYDKDPYLKRSLWNVICNALSSL